MTPNFNRVARAYRWLEYLTLGLALQRCRTHFLPQLLRQRQALVLGDGDGRFLARLLQSAPAMHAVAVDTSSTMLLLLRQRCEAFAPSAAGRLKTVHQNALDHIPSPATDLVAAHFFFDCLSQPELNRLIDCLAADVQPDALWLVSDFRIPVGLMRLPSQLIVRALYFAFFLLTGLRTTHLADYETPLRSVGLDRTAQHHALGGLLTTELWQRRQAPIPTPSLVPRL